MRPLAIMDVDGVIAPYGLRVRLSDASRHLTGESKPLLKTARRLLEILSTQFDVVWCSAGWTAPEIIRLNDRLGTNFPHIPVPTAGQHGAWEFKLPAILDWIGSHAGDRRPIAWFDDSIRGADLEISHHHPGPVLAVAVNGRVGLTGRQVNDAKRWALRLREGSDAAA